MLHNPTTLSKGVESVTKQERLKMVDPELLGERIRQARTEQKISQRDLCKDLFTSAYLSYVELGKTRPTLQNLEKLAVRLNKPVDHFLRPSGRVDSVKSHGTLDKEQTRLLELQNLLLQGQVALTGSDFGQVEQILSAIRLYLGRLSSTDQIKFYLLESGFYNGLTEPEAALTSLTAARQLLGSSASSDPASNLPAEIELETGITYAQQDQTVKAVEHFQNGLNLMEADRPLLNNTVYRRLLWEASRCYMRVGDREKAVSYSQRLLDLPQESRNERAINLYKEGTRLRELGDYKQASFYLGRSQQIWQEINEISALMELTLENAQFQYQSGNPASAYQAAQLAYRLLPAYTENDATKNIELRVLLLLVQAALALKDDAAARTYMTQAEQVFKKINDPDPLEKAGYLSVAGNIAAEMGCSDQAADFYQQAIDLLEVLAAKTSNAAVQPLLAEAYYNSSQVHKKQNNSSKALEYLDKAFRLRLK
jgi:transcriptional regulator with XRE-family HTH domain